MPGSLILSGVGHCLALAALYLGLPHLWVDEPVNERVVIVDLVTVKQDRNLPSVQRRENAKSGDIGSGPREQKSNGCTR